ncbi:MAG: hypothetical protein U1E37_00700 [Sphingomonadaceae bacterium]
MSQWLDEDWMRFLLLALVAIAASLLGWQRDRRRRHRSDPDRVPWMPWRDVAFWSSFAALLLLGAAFQAWMAS